MMPPSACPPWQTDTPGQTAGERNESARSYTTLGDTIHLRWRNAWSGIPDTEIEALRDIIRWAAAGPWPANRIAEEASVKPHDIPNFINGTKRPGHLPGLRMLWFASTVLPRAPDTLPADIAEKVGLLAKRSADLGSFEPDDDYFFYHLQRLNLIDEARCQAICDDVEGHYDSYRLSRNPGKIIRSHYEFEPFTPYNRLPHVVNRLKYGATDDKVAVERTAEGQIFQMGDTYVLIAFVYRGYRRVGARAQAGIRYDGIQVNLFPAGQMGRPPQPVIDGLFLSYVYDDRYEMGRMKLVRKAAQRRAKFDASRVGEFPVEAIQSNEQGLDLSALRLDISEIIENPAGEGGRQEAMMAACLSFIMTGSSLLRGR